jgi:hypothetical protein
VVCSNFIELIAINNSIKNDLHVIRLVGVERNNIVQNFSRSLALSVEFSPRSIWSLFLAVLRKIIKEISGTSNGFNIILELLV